MTETLTEQPTAEALQSRITDTKQFPETVVETPTTGLHDTGRGAAQSIYISRMATVDQGREDWLHTIHSLVPAPTGNGWLDRVTPHRPGASFDRYYGAVVNPEPVNGHYYRSLGEDQYLVRYNDDAHILDRNLSTLPWSLIRGAGTTPWVVPSDGLMGMALHPYVEVEFDEAAPAEEETAVRTAETEEPAAEVATIGNTDRDPTRGMALAEEDGTVLLDPEMVKGGTYLLWADNGNATFDHEYGDTYLLEFVGDDPLNSAHFIPYGYYDWNRGRDELRWTHDYYSLWSANGMHWAKAALVKPEAAEDAGAVVEHDELRDTEREEFEAFNTRANEIARTAGWCNEYDRIVTSVGMRGRYKRYSFDLSVTFTFEDYNPSSATDTQVRERHDLDTSLSLTNIAYTGTIDVTVTVENQPDRESAEGWIDSSVIESALNSATTGLSNFDITDWEVTDWENLDGDDDEDDD
jgi:hypothetical protein